MSKTADKNSKSSAIKSLPMAFDAGDEALLRSAYMALEHPSLAARLSSVVGTPIEIAIHLLPRKWFKRIRSVAEKAIMKSLQTALSSMHDHELSAHEMYHKALVASSGGIAGLFGLLGLLVELPVTTTLMLRGIAEIARDEGEDVNSVETQMACIQVFALGGTTESDDGAETGYYGVRMALSGYMTAAAVHVAEKGFQAESGPIVVKTIHLIASRFGMTVSQRAAAQIVPVVGALGAATVNIIFMQHFQSVARAHFTVRRLERKYGEEFIRSRFKILEEENQPRRSSR
jgi:hypothetical protein